MTLFSLYSSPKSWRCLLSSSLWPRGSFKEHFTLCHFPAQTPSIPSYGPQEDISTQKPGAPSSSSHPPQFYCLSPVSPSLYFFSPSTGLWSSSVLDLHTCRSFHHEHPFILFQFLPSFWSYNLESTSQKAVRNVLWFLYPGSALWFHSTLYNFDHGSSVSAVGFIYLLLFPVL